MIIVPISESGPKGQSGSMAKTDQAKQIIENLRGDTFGGWPARTLLEAGDTIFGVSYQSTTQVGAG